MSTEHTTVELGDISVNVVYKDIKNVHLSVHPPQGRVTISAPLRMDLETIRLFSISKLGWIRKQQAKLRSQEREAPRDYLTRESHYYLGKRYLLKVIERDTPPEVKLEHDTIELYVRKGMSAERRQEILNEWYRRRLKEIAPKYIAHYEKKMNVKVAQFGIKKMKTKWGTCNAQAKRIWINLELAKKPVEYLEYILIHEMVHLLERHHNDKFTAYMDKFAPKGNHYREELNRLALGHVHWNCQKHQPI